MAIINEEKGNPENTITKFQNIIKFHYIYQHFIILMVMIVFHLQYISIFKMYIVLIFFYYRHNS